MRPQKPIARDAVAGVLSLSATIGCAAAGFAPGAPLGAAVETGLAGLFAGLFAGFALVYARSKDV